MIIIHLWVAILSLITKNDDLLLIKLLDDKFLVKSQYFLSYLHLFLFQACVTDGSFYAFWHKLCYFFEISFHNRRVANVGEISCRVVLGCTLCAQGLSGPCDWNKLSLEKPRVLGPVWSQSPEQRAVGGEWMVCCDPLVRCGKLL